MTRTITGTFVACFLLIGASWAIAIPLGASSQVLTLLMLVFGAIPVITHTKYLAPEHQRDPEERR